MERIVERVERDPGWRTLTDAARPVTERRSDAAIASAARQVADTIGAAAIMAFTLGGSTALRVARERPECPVLGLTTSLETARRLSLVWGVHAVVTPETHTMSETVSRAVRIARTEGFANAGQEVVVTAGVPFNQPGSTNALRVARVG